MSKYEMKITTTAIILILLTVVNLFANLYTYTKIINMINDMHEEREAWDEASIIFDGEEIMRGQIDYYYTDDNDETTIFFSDGNVWTTYKNNVFIQHHNK